MVALAAAAHAPSAAQGAEALRDGEAEAEDEEENAEDYGWDHERDLEAAKMKLYAPLQWFTPYSNFNLIFSTLYF